MIDHLNLHSAQIEGLFRKSPKAASVRALRAHLDAGHIVDFHQHSPHVIASLLKVGRFGREPLVSMQRNLGVFALDSRPNSALRQFSSMDGGER